MEEELFNRYSRQILFQPIGADGQKRLSGGYALVVGCGATGSASAGTLARAGVGRLKIIDRDFLEKSNLQRQSLFNEEDLQANLPKAILAERNLGRINSSIRIEGVAADLNPSNIEKLAAGADVILDGTDNFDTRFLINDYSLKTRTPWVYTACVGSQGMVMNIVPGETPCLRCLMDGSPPAGSLPTCETAGILGPTAQLVGAIQVTEALKILTGNRDRLIKGLLRVNTWAWESRELDLSDVRPEDCPACAQGRYDFLQARSGVMTSTLCGSNAVQVVPQNGSKIELKGLAERLHSARVPGGIDNLSYNSHLLRFRLTDRNIEMAVFPDGRAIIQGTKDTSTARDLYSKYIGM